MKSILRYFSALMVAMIFPIFLGCAIRAKNTKLEENRIIYSMPIGANEMPPNIVSAKQPPEPVKNEVIGTFGLETTEPQTRAQQEGWGYKIQVFITTNREEAEREYIKAQEKTKETASIEYDPPNYKVRIGNCKTAEEADELLTKVRRAGYPDAFTVKARVVAE